MSKVVYLLSIRHKNKNIEEIKFSSEKELVSYLIGLHPLGERKFMNISVNVIIELGGLSDYTKR